MRSKFIHGIFFTLTACLLVAPAVAERPDLTGNWRLDVANSRFGDMTPVDSAMLLISTGSHKMINMSMTTRNPQSERTVESQWKIDDHFHPIIGGGSGEVLAKWDGAVLTGKRVRPDGSEEEIRFRLENDGATLTESVQSGANVTTLIWRRE